MNSLPDLNAVFQKARQAEEAVARLSVTERTERLRRLREAIVDESEAIIDRIQRETGKSRSDALMSEIFPVLDHLRYLEKNARRALRDRKVETPLALMGKKSLIYFEPLGTVLIISPWNYPFYQAIVPCTTSFVAGNATIYKPSEHTPLQGLVESLLSKSGFEPDWVQIIYGEGQVGSQAIEQRPDKIFFTGSTRTGRKIMEQASRHPIPVELELGGKDPSIVFEDANISRAAAGVLWGAMTNAGQSCTSVERVYVQRSIYDSFRKELVRIASHVDLGVDPDGEAEIGRMTTDFQVRIVKEHLDEAIARGAIQLTGTTWDGKNPLIPPIILDHVNQDMKIAQEETFGPILPLLSFETEEEAIRLANDSPYGLSASIWSKDLGRATRVARAIKTGNVSINNVMLSEGNHALPFGGVKNSGFGRYKGTYGLEGFSNVKSVLIDSDSGKMEANWYPYTRAKYQIFAQMTAGLYRDGLKNFIRFLTHGLRLESYSNKHKI